MVKIGIDFGTANCFVAALIDGNVQVFENDEGQRTTPSCLRFTRERRIVGQEAAQDNTSDRKETICDIKRIIGRKASDPSVKKFIENTKDFRISVEDDKLTILTPNYDNRGYVPEEIVAIFLREMKSIAENQLPQPVTGAVITVPASFGELQRRAILDAAMIAGLGDARLINETTAVAVANVFHREVSEKERHSIAFHLGAGSTDVTVFRTHGRTIDVLSHVGYNNLGGNDFDYNVARYAIQRQGKEENNGKREEPNIKEKGQITQQKFDRKAMVQLRKSSNAAKKTLSGRESATIKITLDDQTYYECITRNDFEKENDDLLTLALGTITKALSIAKLGLSEIHEVTVVGGPTRVLKKLPKFGNMLEKFSVQKYKRVNEDEAAVMGAALVASELYGDKSFGIVVHDIIEETKWSRLGEYGRHNSENAYGDDASIADSGMQDLEERLRQNGQCFELLSSSTKSKRLRALSERMTKDIEKDLEGKILEQKLDELNSFVHRNSEILKKIGGHITRLTENIETKEMVTQQLEWVNVLDQATEKLSISNLLQHEKYDRIVQRLTDMIEKKDPEAEDAVKTCNQILRQSILKIYGQGYKTVSGTSKIFEDNWKVTRTTLMKTIEFCEKTLEWTLSEQRKTLDEAGEKYDDMRKKVATLQREFKQLAELVAVWNIPNQSVYGLLEIFKVILRRKLVFGDEQAQHIVEQCFKKLQKVAKPSPTETRGFQRYFCR